MSFGLASIFDNAKAGFAVKKTTVLLICALRCLIYLTAYNSSYIHVLLKSCTRQEWLRDASDTVLRLETERANVSLFCGRQSHESRSKPGRPLSSPKGYSCAECRTSVSRLDVQVAVIIRRWSYGARVQGCRFQSGPVKLARKLGEIAGGIYRALKSNAPRGS